MPATTAVLERLPLFRGCTAAELRLVGRFSELVHVPDGEVLVREGRPGHEFFAIAEGRARVDRRGRTVAMLGPGDHFGELAILGQGHRDATVISSGPLELLVLDERAFLGLLAELPSFSRRVLEAMAVRLRREDLGPEDPSS